MIQTQNFICPFKNCGKTFKEKGSVDIHIKIHIGKKEFSCQYPFCSKSFTTKGNLNSHMMTHTGHSKFRCEFKDCKKIYSHRYRLNIHMRTHSNIKPFKCEYEGCGKMFNEKGNMLFHFKLHKSENTYKCYFPKCRFICKSSIILKRHMKEYHRICSNEFECLKCDLKYTRYTTLMDHIKVHDEIGTVDYLEKEENKEDINLHFDFFKRIEDYAKEFMMTIK